MRCHKLLIKMKDTVGHESLFPVINLSKLRVYLTPGLSGFILYKTQEMKRFWFVQVCYLVHWNFLCFRCKQTFLQLAEDATWKIPVHLLILELPVLHVL